MVDSLEDSRVVLEDSRVAIQGFHDRQPDSADIFEGFLGRGLAAGGVLLQATHELFEPFIRPQPLLPPLLVGPAPFFVGPVPVFVSPAPVFVSPLTIGAHLETEIAKLFQDHPGPWI